MLTLAIELVGGLGLFIAGMNMMSHGIEKTAGNKLRGILEAFTKTRLLGVFVGLFFTACIQSSSAATVMVVSFVNSQLMNLAQASGIILGANIGTTVTALLVAFKLSAVAPVFVFAGAIMVNFMKNPMVKKSGEVVLGFGILFIGISTMSGAMADLRSIPAVIDLLANFTNPFLGVILGTVITSVVQSSSVTVSILVVMASQGLVDLNICMFVILGCNIGACTSAVLSAIGGTKNAKRASLIHLLFNVFGTILMFVLLMLFGDFIAGIVRMVSGQGTDSGTLGRNIAMAHFLFKVFQVIVFYPFMDLIIKCTYLLVPGEDEKASEEEFRLAYISTKLPNPAVAIFIAQQEIRRMAHMAFENLNLAFTALLEQDDVKLEKVYEAERYIDFLEQGITNYLVRINTNSLPISDQRMIAAYFHVVNDIERIGDHAQDIAEIAGQCKSNKVHFSEPGTAELTRLLESVNIILKDSLNMFVTGNTAHMDDVRNLEDTIDRMERECQNTHIRRLNEGKCTAQAGSYYSDVCSGLERVSDHATNIAFSLIEAKEALGR